jgi:hypothetical protein
MELVVTGKASEEGNIYIHALTHNYCARIHDDSIRDA